MRMNENTFIRQRPVENLSIVPSQDAFWLSGRKMTQEAATVVPGRAARRGSGASVKHNENEDKRGCPAQYRIRQEFLSRASPDDDIAKVMDRD